jgi:hypothetical protein
MKDRMFRVPCSYLILSEHFVGLPEPVQLEVKRRIANLLDSSEQLPKGFRLTHEDRTRVREMLRELKPGWL